jgi:phasin family protein
MAQTPEAPDVKKMTKDMVEELPDVAKKIVKGIDPTKMVDQFTKMMKDFNLPGLDTDAIVANQRRNVEALTSANRVALEGMQAVIKRQVEIVQETMNEASKAFQSVAKAGSPSEAVAKQTELAKNAFERALSNGRELAEMVSKAQQEATNAINARIAASLDEFKDMVLKLKSESKT